MAVDRERFSEAVGRALADEPAVTQVIECVSDWDADPNPWIIATGPLTADALAQRLQAELGPSCAFFDSIAPIVDADTIDQSIVYALSRYGKGEGDEYLNIPLDKGQYEAFIDAVLTSPKVTPHQFEKPKYFEGCLPLEVVAERGRVQTGAERAILRRASLDLRPRRRRRRRGARADRAPVLAIRPRSEAQVPPRPAADAGARPVAVAVPVALALALAAGPRR